jgi:hypothetical protein
MFTIVFKIATGTREIQYLLETNGKIKAAAR